MRRIGLSAVGLVAALPLALGVRAFPPLAAPRDRAPSERLRPHGRSASAGLVDGPRLHPVPPADAEGLLELRSSPDEDLSDLPLGEALWYERKRRLPRQRRQLESTLDRTSTLAPMTSESSNGMDGDVMSPTNETNNNASDVMRCEGNEILAWSPKATVLDRHVRYMGPSAWPYAMAVCKRGYPSIAGATKVTTTLAKALIGAAALAALMPPANRDRCIFAPHLFAPHLNFGPFVTLTCMTLGHSARVVISGAAQAKNGEYGRLWAPGQLYLGPSGPFQDFPGPGSHCCSCRDAMLLMLEAAQIMLFNVDMSMGRGHFLVIFGVGGVGLNVTLEKLKMNWTHQAGMLHGLGNCFREKMSGKASGKGLLNRIITTFNVDLMLSTDLIWSDVQEGAVYDKGALKIAYDFVQSLVAIVSNGEVNSTDEAC